jgi:hypothetical protein
MRIVMPPSAAFHRLWARAESNGWYSVCAPRAALGSTLPPAMTWMTPARRTVEKRCETKTVVLPAAACMIRSNTVASLRTSRLAVGSSGRHRSPTPEQVSRHEAELKRRGKEYEFHMYPGAGDGFFHHHRPAAYRADQAVEGWKKRLAFFEKHLARGA